MSDWLHAETGDGVVGVFELPVVPARWQMVKKTALNAHFKDKKRKLYLMFSCATELDGKQWLHVSVSHPDRLPSWHELLEIKTTFIGREKYAYQVLAPASKHINLHENCLHLWCCLNDNPIPDFTRGMGMI